MACKVNNAQRRTFPGLLTVGFEKAKVIVECQKLHNADTNEWMQWLLFAPLLEAIAIVIVISDHDDNELQTIKEYND